MKNMNKCKINYLNFEAILAHLEHQNKKEVKAYQERKNYKK